MYTQSSDSAAIHFHQSKWNLDPNLSDNSALLDSIHKKLTIIQGDSIYRVRHVSVIGGASPEGSEKYNKFLSEKRAETLFDHFRQFSKLEEADMTFTYLGRDWEGVLTLALLDPNIPYRDETISLL